MATENISTIKPAGGGDYTSLNDWQADIADKNLVSRDVIEIAEVYGGGDCLSGNLTLSGWTTDSTRYIIIRAAAGQAHAGVWNETKAYGGSFIQAASCCLQLTQMQIKTPTGAGLAGTVGFSGAGAEISIVDRCIIKSGASSTHGIGVACHDIAGGAPIVKNSIILVSEASSGNAMACVDTYNGGNLIVYNCTLHLGGNSTHPYKTAVFNGLTGASDDTLVSQNNYIQCDNGNACYMEGGAGLTKGDQDATYNTEAVTASLRNIAYSTDNFVDVTEGAENLSLTETSALIDVGADLTAQGVTTDIISTARPQGDAYDIGAFEYYIAPSEAAGAALLLALY